MTDESASDPGRLHAKAWAEDFELIDRQLSPLGLAAMRHLQLVDGATVLDIGCGTGQTLLQLADRVGVEGRVLGVDISRLLLDVAARRTAHVPQVELIEADAQALDLPSQSVDAVFSRFGVMAFADAVGAFANFHRILRPGGRLAFICWQGLRNNELDRFPLAAAGFANAIDEGPYSLADPDHLRTVLTAAGFSGVSVRPHTQRVTSGDLDAMTTVLLKVGPLGKIVRETPAIRAAVETKLRQALATVGDEGTVSLSAAIWIVTSERPAA